VDAYNEKLRHLAEKKHVPLIDLYAEMKARAGDAKKYLLSDGKHLTMKACDGPASPENLAKDFFLLRCYLAVRKGMEVKAAVSDAVARAR
jgi:hypothetical protein